MFKANDKVEVIGGNFDGMRGYILTIRDDGITVRMNSNELIDVEEYELEILH